MEVEKDKKIKNFRTDCGGEFISTAFKDYYENEGMKRFLTAPFSLQQNDVVERRNRTIVEMARCMLRSKEMSVVLTEQFDEEIVGGKTAYVSRRKNRKTLERDRRI